MIRHWTPERYISKIVYDGRLRPPRQLGFSASFDQDYVAFEKDPPSDLLGAYLKECKKAPCFALDFNEDNLKTVKLVQRAKYIDLIDFGPLDCSENDLDKIVGDFVWVEGPVSLECFIAGRSDAVDLRRSAIKWTFGMSWYNSRFG